MLVGSLVSVLGCQKLIESLKEGSDGGAAPVASAVGDAAAPVAVSTESAPAPTTAAADEAFSAPGACIDVAADLAKRTNSRAPQIVDKFDLDGDGKSDKIVRLDLSEVPGPTFVYVMRGVCGHFVGTFTANSVKLSGNKSKGLKSLEVFEQSVECTDPCKCNDKSTAFFFNGKAYQAAKSKDVPRKCDGGAPAPSAAASAGAAGKLCKVDSDCGDDERCITSSGKSACKRIDCAGITPGMVMISEGTERDCARPCKKDSDCPQNIRPGVCTPGVLQQKTRKPISTCFPR